MIFHLLAQSAGYRPFLDPLPVWPNYIWPWLVVPLCAAVSIVYKSIRCKSMNRVPREASGLTAVILLGLGAAAIVLTIIVLGIVQRY